VIIFGIVTLLWGVLNANYFGVTPETMAKAGGFVKSAEAGARSTMMPCGRGWILQPYREDDAQRGALVETGSPDSQITHHQGIAHHWLSSPHPGTPAQGGGTDPGPAGSGRARMDHCPCRYAGADLAYAVHRRRHVPTTVWGVLLAAMLPLSSWFGKPDRNMAKRLLLGFASSMLPLLSTFSDTMSYVRLFAVGLASYYIASAFNTLAAALAETATWLAAVPVLLLGHGLNIGLATIAIFAHGVRLNMLEFSNHAGVQWGGYAYRPFSITTSTISRKEPS
jgi:hypothetical protein